MNNFVTIHEDYSTQALAWAKEHCPNFITVDLNLNRYSSFAIDDYDFFFADSEQGRKEMMWFALRWA
jgi:hypothetical protein